MARPTCCSRGRYQWLRASTIFLNWPINCSRGMLRRPASDSISSVVSTASSILLRCHISRVSKAASPVATPSAKIPAVIIGSSRGRLSTGEGRLPRGSGPRTPPHTLTTRSSFASSGFDAGSINGSEYTTIGGLPAVGLRVACFTATANVTKLIAELFRMLTSSKPLGRRFSVAVICASSEKTQASTNATEVTVLIPILSFRSFYSWK